MKVEIEKITLGVSPLTEEVYAGVIDPKNKNQWKHKVRVHDAFIHAVITCYEGKITNVSDGINEYEITVKKIK